MTMLTPSCASAQVFFIIAPSYVFSEADVVLPRELLTNLLLSLAGVAIISLFTLIHPAAVAIVVGAVVVVDLALFAELWLVGIPLNLVRAACSDVKCCGQPC